MDSVLDAALTYARKALRVIPIAPRSKFPRGIEGWQDLATTDPDTITDWWTNTWPHHGIGIATGLRDDGTFFFVLDVDDRDTHSGTTTLTNLETLHGKLPDTLTCRTGTGGRHYYFTSTTAIHNDAGKRLGPGLDIRGIGGQVLAPPTIHPNGTPYTWEHRHPIANAPHWLEYLLSYEPDRTQIDTHRPNDELLATGGTRPSDRFNATHTWHNLLTADGWTWSHQDKNTDYWVRPGKDPRDGISATTNWNGLDLLIVFSTNAPLPVAGYTKFGYWAYTKHGGDWKKATADYLGRNPTPTPTPTTPDEIRQLFIHWPDFWASDFANQTDWLLEPLVARGRQTALFAQAKQGKSLFVLNVVAALATGRPALGQPAKPPIDVIYLDYEMTPQDLDERLSDMGYDETIDMSKLHYALIPSLPSLDTEEGAQAVRAMVKATGAQLVVIDTMGRAVAGEENSADTYRNYARTTGLALKAMGVAVVRTDHAGKSLSKGQRGSSAKNDDSEIVYELRRDGHDIHLKTTHSRVGWTQPGYHYRQLGDPLRFEPIISAEESKPLTALQSAIHANLVRLALDPTIGVKKARKAFRAAGQSAGSSDFDRAWKHYTDPLERTAPPRGTTTAPPDEGATAPRV